MNPRFSINTLCLETAPFDVHVEQVLRLSATAISPTLEEVIAFGESRAAGLLADAGLTVATLTHRAFAFATPEQTRPAQQRLEATINLAEAIGARSITMTTGGRDHLSWSEAARRFAEAIAPCAARANAAGVRLAIEPTSHLYADVSIAHRLTDTVQLARDAGISLGVDLFACWFDSDIEEALVAAAPFCALVQVSDYVSGDRALPCRAAPGDGAVPLERLIPIILKAGFKGYFDLEIIGPRIAAEGPSACLSRSAAYLEALLPPGA